MINNVFEESLVNALTKGLHRIPKGTKIPLDVPLVVVEGEGPAVVTIWRNGHKDFAYSTQDYYVASGDEKVQEYAATKFWEPDSMDENDRSDRVLVGVGVNRGRNIRVVWNPVRVRWVRMGGDNLEFFTLKEVVDSVSACWDLEFDNRERDGLS